MERPAGIPFVKTWRERDQDHRNREWWR